MLSVFIIPKKKKNPVVNITAIADK